MYSLKEAKNAVQDWIDVLATMDWRADWALQNWRHVIIAAAIALPTESSTILRADEGNRPPIRLDVDDGQCGKFGSD
jgi:hypothetical protein